EINAICWQLIPLIENQIWEKVFELLNQIPDREIAASLRFACLAQLEKAPQQEIQMLIKEIETSFDNSNLLHHTMAIEILYQLLPRHHFWYAKTESAVRWEYLFGCIFISSLPDDLESSVSNVVNHFTLESVKADVLCNWAIKLVRKQSIDAGIMLFQIASPEESEAYLDQFLETILHSDHQKTQLVTFLQYCQTHPKLLFRCITGLCHYFDDEQLIGLAATLNVEGKRLEASSQVALLSLDEGSQTVDQLNHRDLTIFLNEADQHVSAGELKTALYFLLRSRELLDQLEGTEYHDTAIHHYKLSASFYHQYNNQYSKALSFATEVTYEDTFGQNTHHYRLAKLYYDRYCYETADLSDLQLAINALAGFWKYIYGHGRYDFRPVDL
ncbi:MAG: hypothetical protein AAFO69_21705, partial [Bacteroidota bacterium]